MGREYTTDALIDSIAIRGSFPVDQSTFPPQTVLRIADDELQTTIAPAILSLRAAHFLSSIDYTTSGTNQVYAIPPTAMNRALQNVAFVDPMGVETTLVCVDHDTEMDRWDPFSLQKLGGRQGYYVSGDNLVLFPAAASGKTLRLFYYRLPNRLIPTDDAAKVLSVDAGTGIVTCTSVPAAWATGISLCCVSGTPGFQLRFEAQTTLDVASPNVQLSSVSGILPGDWLAPEGDSPIPQIPIEAHPLLAQAVVVKVLEALGDPKITVSQAKYAEILQNYANSFALRVEQAPRKIVGTRNLSNYMRG